MASLLNKHNLALTITNYFENAPWKDDYNGLDRQTLFQYLQISYKDTSGDFFPMDEFFLERVREEIERQIAIIQQTPPPSQPQAPFFADKLEEMVDRYEKLKGKPVDKKTKENLLTNINYTTNLLRGQWELERQKNLIENVITPETAKASQNLDTELKSAFQTFIAKHPELTDTVVNQTIKEITEGIQKSSDDKETITKNALEKQLAQASIDSLKISEITSDTAGPLWTDPKATTLAERLGSIGLAERDMVNFREILEKRVQDPKYQGNYGFETVHLLAQKQTTLYIDGIVEKIKVDLNTAFGFTPEEIQEKKNKIIEYVLQNTADSPALAAESYPQDEFKTYLSSTVNTALDYYLAPEVKRPIIAWIPETLKKVRGEKTNYEKLQDIKNAAQGSITLTPELIIQLQASSFNTYSSNIYSIEKGDPLGRIPFMTKIQICSLGIEELDGAIGQMLAYPDINNAQKTALNQTAKFIKDLYKQNPKMGKAFTFYYRHYHGLLGLGNLKSYGMYALQHPAAAGILPYYLVKNYVSQTIQMHARPWLIDKISGVPAFGVIGKFWFKKNAWGYYEGLPERFKHEVQYKVIRKSVNVTASILIKAGKKYKNKKLKKAGYNLILGKTGLSKLLLKWSFIGGPIKDIFKLASTLVFLILFWASQNAITFVTTLFGSIVSGLAAIKVFGIVGGFFAPFIGPLAAIPAGLAAAATWVGGTALFAKFGDFLFHHGISLPAFSHLGPLTLPLPGAAAFAGLAVPITGVFLTTTLLYDNFYFSQLMAGFNPYRSVETNLTNLQPNGQLKSIFQKAANEACIPVAALEAISRIEASGTWNYTPEEVQKFSTSGWWNTASQDELIKGYCTDTCAVNKCALVDKDKGVYCTEDKLTNPAYTCTSTTVIGPMQFEELTWAAKYGRANLMERCNLEKSVQAAAQKIKANSGDDQKCNGNPYNGDWSEDTMKKASKAYCGSCGSVDCAEANLQCRENNPCGTNYCQTAWNYYQAYANP